MYIGLKKKSVISLLNYLHQPRKNQIGRSLIKNSWYVKLNQLESVRGNQWERENKEEVQQKYKKQTCTELVKEEQRRWGEQGKENGGINCMKR